MIIEKPILDLLDIDRETELEIKTDGEALIIRPVRGPLRDELARSSARMMDIHDETFRKLAK